MNKKPLLATNKSITNILFLENVNSVLSLNEVFVYIVDVILLYKNHHINRAKYKAMLKRIEIYDNSIHLTKFNKNVYHCKIMDEWFDNFTCRQYYEDLHSYVCDKVNYNNVLYKAVTGKDIFNALKVRFPVVDKLLYDYINNMFTSVLERCMRGITKYNVDSINKLLSYIFGCQKPVAYVNFTPETPFVWDYESDRDGEEDYNWVQYLHTVMYYQRKLYEKVIEEDRIEN